MSIYDFTSLNDMRHTWSSKKVNEVDDVFACYGEVYELETGYSHEDKIIQVYKRKNKRKPDKFISLEFNSAGKDVFVSEFVFVKAVDIDLREVYPEPNFFIKKV